MFVPPEIRVFLESLDDPPLLMGLVLEHALRQSNAARGMIFDSVGVVRSAGYSAGDKISVWRALDRLLVESHGLEHSSKALFGVLDAPAWGLAGVLTGASGPLAASHRIRLS